jgi:tetratricopeptide (TPR) repeat protein
MEAQTWLADVLSLHTLRQRTDRAPDDLARAEELVKQALAASPRNSHAHYDKAQILRAQGRCREAVPEYETVISLNPNFGRAYGNLGWCKFLTGSIEDLIPLEEKAGDLLLLMLRFFSPLLAEQLLADRFSLCLSEPCAMRPSRRCCSRLSA